MIAIPDYIYMNDRDKRIIDAFCEARPSPIHIDTDYWEGLLRAQYGEPQPSTFEALFEDEKPVEIDSAALAELLTGGEM